jgi:uncharacterized phage protein gp47/JayE
MSSYGVLTTGFSKKDIDIIVDELEAAFRVVFGDGINTQATSAFGQIIGIISEREADMWDLAEAVYNAQYPDTAGNQSLDNVMALTGIERIAAAETTVDVICTGLAATVLTVGRVVTNAADVRFESTEEKTLALATAWATGTAYVLGDIRSNDSNIYVCVQAGTSAGAGGPTGTGDDIVDNTCKWDFCGDGLSYADVPFQAEETGALSCIAGAIHTDAVSGNGAIQTPVSGWEDARNIADGTIGRAIETDAAARLRRASLLHSSGLGALDAMVAHLLDNVDDVTSVFGFENTTDSIDADGLPAHSVEMVVLGGADQDIWDEIWTSKSGGIETYGTESGTVTDATGTSQTVYFNRPTEKRIHTIIEGTKDSDYPTDGDTQIKTAIAAWGNALGCGEDVIQSLMYAIVTGISGVTDVTKIWISIHPVHPPVAGSNLAIAAREISTWDTGDIDVTMT